MKNIITLGFCLFMAVTSFGQHLDYDNDSRWFFGMNVGAAWNTTDVENETHAGWGLLLGKRFNSDYGRALSYDVRLRYLRGMWYGQDYDTTNLSHLGADYSGALQDYKEGPGYTVNNFQADVHELGLELAVHLNGVVDRSRWDPYIFGGANIVWNRSNGNLYDNISQPPSIYAYDTMPYSNVSSLDVLMDNTYDTPLDGSSTDYDVDFMPSLGIGLGYQVGPRFSIGVEHKTTFTLADNFDGYQDNTPRWGIFENDIYHYTNAYLRFGFRARGTRPTVPPVTEPDPTQGNITNPAPCQDPVIRLIRPDQHTITVEDQAYVFRADVRFVASRNDISLEINGVPNSNFLYNHNTRQLESNIQLNPGSNSIKVIARNTCGNDTEFVTIIYNDCEDPIVRFDNTNVNGSTVASAAYNVRATIQNGGNVVYTVNGVQTTNFSYNSVTGQFSSNVTLRRGQNTIQITVTNECGTDTETITVNYADCADPYINFVAGNGSIVQSNNATYKVQAYVFNVTSKSNIAFTVNGVNKYFTFNTSTKLLESDVQLNSGQNTIQIVATNNCGNDVEIISVDYTPCVDPAIQLLAPLTATSSTQNSNETIRAKVFNVASVNNIQLYVNGVLQPVGVFNPATKVFEKTVALSQGINTIKLVATNSCGAEAQSFTINYTPCLAPDLQLVLPASLNTTTAVNSQVVQAMVFNINSSNQVQLYVNGTIQPGGVYSPANGVYQNTVGLVNGTNTIQLVATNDCGSDVQVFTVNYVRCTPPTISVVAPIENPMNTQQPAFNVSTIITGVDNEMQVTTTVNGVVQDGGEHLNEANGNYTNLVELVIGTNNIVITATNNCGSVSTQVTIIREDDEPVIDEMITICYLHENNVGEPQTIQIPLSQWPQYQAQGAQMGPCPEPVDEEITICLNVNGEPTQLVILQSQWAQYQALGAELGACPEETMEICLDGNNFEIPVSEWEAYQAQGATEGPCPVVVETMIICLNGEQAEIPVSQWPQYQNQGATQGPCQEPTMTICYNNQAIIIPVSEWPEYEALGAVKGTCRQETMLICLDGTELNIPVAQWPVYQRQGATQGPCATQEMTICFEGNTMVIPVSKWPALQAKGATEGPCEVVMITVCFKGETIEINEEEWAKYRKLGAVLGECDTNVPTTEEKITICHYPPGNTENPQEIQIPLSAWPAHQAHGDKLGPCEIDSVINTGGVIAPNGSGNGNGSNNEKITICHYPPGNNSNPQEIQIALSAWPAHQAHGDVLGPCSNGDTTSTGGAATGNGTSSGTQVMTICYTPEGETIPQTIQIPIDEWDVYLAQGAYIGPCSTVPSGGSGTSGSTGSGSNTNSNTGTIGNGGITNPNSGSSGSSGSGGSGGGKSLNPQEGGSTDLKGKTDINTQKAAEEKAKQEAELKAQKEAAAKKAAEEKAKQEAAKKAAEEKVKQEAQLKAQKEAAAKKAAEEKAKQEAAAKKAAEEKAKQEAQLKAQKEAAAKKAAEEKAKQEAAKKAAEEKAKQEAQLKAQKEAAAKKAAEEKAKQEAAAKKAAEEKAKQEAQLKAQKEAAAKKAAEEKAKQEAAAKKAAEEKAKREAQLKAQKEAAAKKAAEEKAKKEAAAKKANEEKLKESKEEPVTPAKSEQTEKEGGR